MKVIRLDPDARDAFLADARLGTLALLRPSGAPAAAPLWYGWDGERAAMVSERRSAKVRWLEHDPRACLLVANIPPEPARWVSLEGRAVLSADCVQDEAERLARRYLLPEPYGEIQTALDALRRLDLVRITLLPERIRSYAEIP